MEPRSGDQNLPGCGLDGTARAGGYTATPWLGPEVVACNMAFVGRARAATGELGLKDTVVHLHARVENGREFKLCTSSPPLGYEVSETASNPDPIRPYGSERETTAQTGMPAGHPLRRVVLANAGGLNTWSAGIAPGASPWSRCRSSRRL